MTGQLALSFAWYGVAGWLYFALVGGAAAPWLLPRAWRIFWPAAVPFLGWAVVVALVYPLNAALPALPVLRVLGILAIALCGVRAVRLRSQAWPRCEPTVWIPIATGVAAYAAHASLYVRAGTLSSLVADSDVEHFADVVAALLHYPIGWSLEAQMGLEATPVGLAYHYVHAALSGVTGADTFATASASHLLMLALAPSSVYVFARSVLSAPPRAAAGAAALGALHGAGLGVAAFGWGQQMSALSSVPAGIAAVHEAICRGDRRDVLGGGLVAALAAGSLYLATAPLIGATAALYGLALVVREGRIRPLSRAAALAVVVSLAGVLSHVSAAGFFVVRGGLGGEDTSGRSTHVATFVSPLELLGGAPIALFRPPSRAGEGGLRDVIYASAAGSAALLAGIGAVRSRRITMLGAFVAGSVAFDLYLRVLRPFPYGEFKLLTSAWFIVPCL
ncbi:MAG TPA: hypothetical protein VFX49_14950, partial [Chloroflexota bacterium]|nr:hypothetical protein [Chloroflexota bacterium]